MTERRRDPVTGEWRTFATDRQDRTFLPAADQCPLCPTTDPARPTEIPWPAFDVVVFDNRFPSFVAEPGTPAVAAHGPFAVSPNAGAAEVVVYSDDHAASLGGLGRERIELLVDVWTDRYADLGARPEVGYVFVFENRGEAIGVTLHHPHGQIYGYPDVPPLPARELAAARAYHDAHGACVYCAAIAQERADAERVVAENGAFLAFVPFAARLPYEVHLAPKRHAASLLDLRSDERRDFAGIIDDLLRAYDGLWGFPLPYVMAMHQAPTTGGDWSPISHLHVEFTPLHRRADRLKYLAGSELGGGAFLNDVAPEQAAKELRAAGRSGQNT